MVKRISGKMVDLFAGVGGASKGGEKAGAKVILAANHWKLAVAAHQINHPNTKHLCQDLNQADFYEFPDHDILWASPACIPLDQLVEMADGTRRAALDLEVGDMVLTDKGRARPILNKWSKIYTGEMLSLTMWGDTKQSVRMTTDHRVMVMRRKYKGSADFDLPVFVAAEELRKGDYMAFPLRAEVVGTAAAFVSAQLPSRHQITFTSRHGTDGEMNLPGHRVELDGESEDLWWLIGHYLGDGDNRKDRPEIGFSTGDNIENFVKVREILGSFGLSSWVEGEVSNRRVQCSSTHLNAILSKFGRLAHVKFIPADLHSLELRFCRALVDGYMAADGSNKKGRRGNMRRATTTSLELAQGIQYMAWRLGLSSGVCINNKARKATIEGREVNCKDSWEVWVQEPHKQSRTKFRGGMVWRGIRSIECAETREEVLDFEVEEDHTFCLPGVVVHNCQGHSKAAQGARKHKLNMRQKHDKMRSTAWAVVNCLEAKQPQFAFIENVLDFPKWQLYPMWKMCIEQLGYAVEEHIADATQFGVPQLRERWIVVATRSKSPMGLVLPSGLEKPAIGPHLDWNDEHVDHRELGWRPIASKPIDVQRRVQKGRERGLGEIFLTQYVTDHPGVPLHEPIRTITTKSQWALVRGDEIRMLRVREIARAMGFEDDYRWPAKVIKDDKIKGFGNAVSPPMAEWFVRQALEAA